MTEGEYYLLEKSNLEKFLDSLRKKMTLYAPIIKDNDFHFTKVGNGREVNLKDYHNCVYPPKDLFLREGEVILEYNNSKILEKLPKEKSAIFAIRPCDVHALMVLDRVMLGHDHTEPIYKKHRENTLIFALRCNEPCKNSFCESMGTYDITESFDLLFTDNGNFFHIETGSPGGERIIADNKNLFSSTIKKADVKKIESEKKLDTSNLPEIMETMKDSKIWDEIADNCLSCASCTYSCPTCFCFNLVHETEFANKDIGKVVREMDYCMLTRFTRVAGNSVFRQERTERVKQFFYHKLLFGLKNEDKQHCVGCGRCITECMAKIDITEGIKRIRDAYERKKF